MKKYLSGWSKERETILPKGSRQAWMMPLASVTEPSAWGKKQWQIPYVSAFPGQADRKHDQVSYSYLIVKLHS